MDPSLIRNTILCPHTTIPDQYHTCEHSHHSSYSATDLPPILFALEQKEIGYLSEVEDLIENGTKALDWEGKPIRDFPFLPRYISIDVPGWMLEYWSRTDSRLTYKDIRSRMTAPILKKRTSENTLNMRREREARGPLTLSCWSRRRNPLTRMEVGRVEHRSVDEIFYNTTMKVLHNSLGRSVALRKRGLIRTENGLVYTTRNQPTYALNTFLEPGETSHTLGDRLKQTFSLYNQLAAKARELDCHSWQLLPLDELPKQWAESKDPKESKEVKSFVKYTFAWYKEGGRAVEDSPAAEAALVRQIELGQIQVNQGLWRLYKGVGIEIDLRGLSVRLTECTGLMVNLFL